MAVFGYKNYYTTDSHGSATQGAETSNEKKNETKRGEQRRFGWFFVVVLAATHTIH